MTPQPTLPLRIPLSGFALRFISIALPANALYHFCIGCTDQDDVFTQGVGKLTQPKEARCPPIQRSETLLFLRDKRNHFDNFGQFFFS